MLAKLAERFKNGKDPAQRATPTHTLTIRKATGARCHLGGGWPTKPTSTYTYSYSVRGDGRCFIIFTLLFKTRRKGANEAPTTHERTRTHANPRKTQTHTHTSARQPPSGTPRTWPGVSGSGAQPRKIFLPFNGIFQAKSTYHTTCRTSLESSH